jgi:hypothetical protein
MDAVIFTNRPFLVHRPSPAIDGAVQRPLMPADRHEWDDIIEAHDTVKSIDMVALGLREQPLLQASEFAEARGQGTFSHARHNVQS